MEAAAAVFAAAVTLGLAVWLVWQYAHAETSAIAVIAVSAAWWLGFFGLALLPLDIALSFGGGRQSPAWMETMWKIVYWATFALAWLVLPVLSEAEASGESHWLRRLRVGCVSSMRTYAWFAAAGVAVTAYLVLSGRFTGAELVAVAATGADAYGQLLVALLSGYGLATMPWRLLAWIRGASVPVSGLGADAWTLSDEWERASAAHAQLQRDLAYAADAVGASADGAALDERGEALLQAARYLAAAPALVRPLSAPGPEPSQGPTGSACVHMPDGTDAYLLEGGALSGARVGAAHAWALVGAGRRHGPGAVGAPRSAKVTLADAEALRRRAHRVSLETRQLVTLWARALSRYVSARAAKHTRPPLWRTVFGWLVLCAALGLSAVVALSQAMLMCSAVHCGAASEWPSPTLWLLAGARARGGVAAWMSLCAVLLLWQCASVFFALFSVKVLRAASLYRGQLTRPTALLLNATYACRLQFSLGLNALLVFGLASGSSAGASGRGGTAFGVAVVDAVKAPAIDRLVPVVGVSVAVLLACGVLGLLLSALGLPELSATDSDNVRLGLSSLDGCLMRSKTHARAATSSKTDAHERIRVPGGLVRAGSSGGRLLGAKGSAGAGKAGSRHRSCDWVRI